MGEKGIAISCVPSSGLLHPWEDMRITIACATDMLGVYHDSLHVRAGTLAPWDIPVRIGIVGTPLQLHCERPLPEGLKVERLQESLLRFGDVPSGVEVNKTFHVVNTSNMDMHIDWEVRVHCAGDKKVGMHCRGTLSGASFLHESDGQ